MNNFIKKTTRAVLTLAIALTTTASAMAQFSGGNGTKGGFTREPSNIPYYCNFEDDAENAQWTLLNGTQTNKWHIGSVVAQAGAKSLYVSNNGTAHTYTTNATSYVYAYRTLNFSEAGRYSVSFNWISNAEGSFDNVRAFLVPADISLEAGNAYGNTSGTNNVPANWIAIGTILNGQTSWQNFSVAIRIQEAGLYNLVFFWKNDNLSGSQPPAAIDNIEIVNVTNHVCDPITIFPWEEDFTSTIFPPSICWEDIRIQGAGSWTRNTLTPYTTPACAYFLSVAGSNNLLKLPKMTIANDNLMLEFWSRIASPANYGAVNGAYSRVLVSTTDDNYSSFTQVKQLEGAEVADAWQKIAISLEDFAGEDIYIAFQYITNTFGHSWRIDDIKVKAPVVDGEVAAIVAPEAGLVYNLTANEQVKVLVKNNGDMPLTNFNMKLELDNIEIANETYSGTPIPAGGEMQYIFNATLDLSALITYQIKASIICANDANATNDTKTISVTNRYSPFAAGNGTATNPFIIMTPEQLEALAICVQSNSPFNNQHYKLGNNIDLSGYGENFNNGLGWSPIGTDSANVARPFKGVFDGGNYKVTGLYINTNTTVNVGLFGRIDSATIRNLGVENVDITITTSGTYNVGAVVGYSANSTVLNCNSTGTLNASGNLSNSNVTKNIGGVVGYLITGSVSNCYSSSTINASPAYTSSNQFGASFVGGVVGYVRQSGTISNCYSTGIVNANAAPNGNTLYLYAGGVVGHIQGSEWSTSYNSYIFDSYSSGTVNAFSYDYYGGEGTAGGVVGRSYSNAHIMYCHSSATVNSNNTSGGIIGNQFESYVSRCYSTGTVFANNEGSGYQTAYVGGISGYGESYSSSTNSDISNCYSAASIIAIAQRCYAGGIAGGIRNMNILNCYSIGTISADMGEEWGVINMGGIVGERNDASAGIMNCAALNPSLSYINLEYDVDFGRIYGWVFFGGTAGLANNAGFDNMINPSGGTAWYNTGATNKDGANISAATINADGTLGGRFTTANGWTVQNGKLPGFGAPVDMPAHLRPQVPPTITTETLPVGKVGYGYNQTLEATGAYPMTWSLESGALPNGLTLTPGGVITGTPTTVGTFNFTVKATNSLGNDTKDLGITVVLAFYAHDFEDELENAQWTLLNGTQINKWHIGATVAHGAGKSLYISNNGTAHTYTTSSATSYVYAYRTLNFEPGTYPVSFNWICNAEYSYDNVRAFLVPDNISLEAGNAYGNTSSTNNVPANWIAVSPILSGQTTWQNFINENISIQNAGLYKLVFFWKNDASSGSQPPAAIDNIVIINPFDFVPVTNITGVPEMATAGTPLTLTGTVVPSNATNQTIVWSVQSAGTTGATITGNTLNTTAAGTVTVRATIVNGASPTTPYTKDFSITVSLPFVPVTNITGVPETATAGTPLTLTGTVVPSNATNQTIVWSVQSAGTTGATITGNTLNTTAAGTVIILATIADGLAVGEAYTQEFTVTVTATQITHIITASVSGGNGTITPSGDVEVEDGKDQTFTIIPAEGYRIQLVLVDGIENSAAMASGTYTFTNVTANHTIEAFFDNIGIGKNEEINIKVFSHHNVVTIINETLIPLQQVAIIDMYGRSVWKGKAPDVKTEISLGVATGIYLVRITTGKGRVLINKVSIY